jgi:hypothetical protein
MALPSLFFLQGGIDAFFKYDGQLGCWWDEQKGTHTVAGEE